jgi:hypothetical protein
MAATGLSAFLANSAASSASAIGIKHIEAIKAGHVYFHWVLIVIAEHLESADNA